MKRIFKLTSLVLALMLALSMVGCKGKPYSDSSYLGEWKANSIQSRNAEEIVYTTLTLKLEADGTCNYCGRTGTWEPLEDSSVKLTLGDEVIKLIVALDGDKVVLKYRIDTFYKAADFVPKDRESVSPPTTKEAGSDDQDLPEIFGQE